jgi:Membrane carboxypeptidase/penicillin-binding protein PbpC
MITTVDSGIQNTLEHKINEYIERNKAIGIRNAASLLVDWRSMEVLSLVGSADFNNQEIQGRVNGTRAKRSPGSTLKPFIYALAFEQGIIHPMTLLKDVPSAFGEWSPENCDRGFAGPIHAREALTRSRNVPAVTIAAQLNNPTLYEFLKNTGITQLRSPDFYGLALVLGGAEMTMEELVTLYAALANGGVLKPLRFLMDDPAVNDGRRVLSPEVCWLVLDILKDASRPDQGYDRTWAMDPLPQAGKKGTSYSYRDAWCIGIFGPHVLAVWIGNFDGESNPAFVGREAAAPLFFEIIEALKAHHNTIPQPIRNAGKIKRVEVCTVSGQTPGVIANKRHRRGLYPASLLSQPVKFTGRC